MAAAVGHRRQTDNPPEYREIAGAGWKYCAGGSDTEEITYESTEWGVEDMEESALEEEAVTAMEAREARWKRTATAGGGRGKRRGQ